MAKHIQNYKVESHGLLSETVWTARLNHVHRHEIPRYSASKLSAAEVVPFDPVYVIPHDCVYNIKQWSRAHPLEFGQPN